MTSKFRKILLPTMIALFILEVLTLPLVLRLTYATKSQSPEHILTYADQKLYWDADTKIDALGTAELRLFADHYVNVISQDHSKVIAPGTQGSSIVRLKNNEADQIRYTAVAYRIRSDENLPVTVTMQAEQAFAASEYRLPENVRKSDVISAVTGTLIREQIQDFSVDWFWEYEESTAQDAADTFFGEKSAYADPDDVIVGLYITIETQEGEIIVSAPQTGDATVVWGYLLLMAVSLGMILLLTMTKGKKQEDEI